MNPSVKNLNLEALFSDGSEDFIIKQEGFTVPAYAVIMRTAKNNAQSVLLVTPHREYLMEKVDSRGYFDFYQTKLDVAHTTIAYYFRVEGYYETCFYNRYGVVCGQSDAEEGAFYLASDFQVPDWSKGAVMYQIFVDRFCNGYVSGDVMSGEYLYLGQQVKRVVNWDQYPDADLDVYCFYGGDLQGVLDKLDYLQYLGIEVIYFNPLFVSPSNHKYDTQDYDYIDPHLCPFDGAQGDLLPEGAVNNQQATYYKNRAIDLDSLQKSNDFFIQVVEEIHKRGMRVIMDGVFNHCGSFNKWMDRERIYEGMEGYAPGAYIDKDSPYHSFFTFYQDKWPYNTSYKGWWNHDTLPKLNYENSPQLVTYVMEVARKWVGAPFHVDGWRLDVAADLGESQAFNHQFWRKFRKNVKSENPDALILAEHYGDPSSWLLGDQWDSVMNYDAFMEPISWFLTGMEKHSDYYQPQLKGNGDAFFHIMNKNMANFSFDSLLCAMNELSNHDHSRFLTRTNGMVGRARDLGYQAAQAGLDYSLFRSAVVMQMTWPGAPTIYYGDEAGLCGFTDPDNRRTYPWGREDFELIEFHRDLIRLRKENPALRTGSYKPLYCADQLISYGRFNKKNQVVIIVNTAGESFIDIPVWEIGVCGDAAMRRLMLTRENGYNIGKIDVDVKDGILSINVPARCSLIFAVSH